MRHGTLKFKFVFETWHLNTGSPTSKVNTLRSEVSCVGQNSALAPGNGYRFIWIFHKSVFHVSFSQLIYCFSFSNAVPKRAAFNPKDPHFHAEKFQGLLHPIYTSTVSLAYAHEWFAFQTPKTYSHQTSRFTNVLCILTSADVAPQKAEISNISLLTWYQHWFLSKCFTTVGHEMAGCVKELTLIPEALEDLVKVEH